MGNIFPSRMQMSIRELINIWIVAPSGIVCCGWRGEKRKRNHVGKVRVMVIAMAPHAGLSFSQFIAVIKTLKLSSVPVSGSDLTPNK